jgi:hypothetical protein
VLQQLSKHGQTGLAKLVWALIVVVLLLGGGAGYVLGGKALAQAAIDQNDKAALTQVLFGSEEDRRTLPRQLPRRPGHGPRLQTAAAQEGRYRP